MAKIDIDKFVASIMKCLCMPHREEAYLCRRWIYKALDAQGLKFENGEIVKSQRTIAAEAKEALYNSIWCRANGDYLPPKDKPVIVLIQHDYMERTEYAVSFAHIVDASLYAGSKYIPKDYNGWNIPDVKYWLDLDLPKEK